MYNIFADESCQDAHHYLVLGGVIVATEDTNALEERIEKLRVGLHLYDEMKWSKVSQSYLGKYKQIVDLFFELTKNDDLHFHSLIADSHKLNHRKFSAGDRELGFNKLIYQLLIHKFGRKYGDLGPLYVYLDKRNTVHPLDELKLVLNNGMGVWNNRTRPFKRVHFLDSKSSLFLQLNDVVIGAIGWHKNGHDNRPGASKAKTELADYIAGKAELKRLGYTSPFRAKRFTMWNMDLQK